MGAPARGGDSGLSPSPRPHDVTFFANRGELREWLDANHTSADELWIGYHKKHTGRASVTWEDVVDEALRVGWIDGVRFSLRRRSRRAADHAPSQGQQLERAKRRDRRAPDRRGRDAAGRARRLRGANAGADRDLFLRTRTGCPDRRRNRPTPGRRRCLGRLGAPPAVLSTRGHVLARQREAPRDARTPVRDAPGRLGGRPTGPRRCGIGAGQHAKRAKPGK